MVTEAAASGEKTITRYEEEQIRQANESGKPPVVFVHGLWLMPNSWDRWVTVFEEAGYAGLTPGWPDDPETVEEANRFPDKLAGQTIGRIAEHFDAIIGKLRRKPAVIGHSSGGLVAQILAARSLSAATVAIDPAPFRGVLPLPISALKSGWPFLHKLANRKRAVSMTLDQFRFGFANAIGEREGEELFEKFAVPGSGAPLFQAASANLTPWTEAEVDTDNPGRGPLLIISGEKDHMVPHAVARAAFEQQKRDNLGVTEFHEFLGRGHSLVIDHGWKDVADRALAFVRQFVQ
jgi:non-heme chloroperoxidase